MGSLVAGIFSEPQRGKVLPEGKHVKKCQISRCCFSFINICGTRVSGSAAQVLPVLPSGICDSYLPSRAKATHLPASGFGNPVPLLASSYRLLSAGTRGIQNRIDTRPHQSPTEYCGIESAITLFHTWSPPTPHIFFFLSFLLNLTHPQPSLRRGYDF